MNFMVETLHKNKTFI